MKNPAEFVSTRIKQLTKPQAYFFAGLLAIAGFLVRLWFPNIFHATPFLTFYPAVVISAALGGFGPGMLASVALCGIYFLDPRRQVIGAAGTFELIRILVFLSSGLVISLVSEAQIRARSRLRFSEEQLRLATTAAQIGVWSWKPGTNDLVVSANWKSLFGVDAEEEVTFDTWRNRLHPEDRERAVAELMAAQKEHRDFNTEYRIVRPDGSIRSIVDRGRAWYDDSGDAFRMSGINLDIMDRKKAEEALRESEERFRAFVTTSSDVVYRMSADWGEMRHLQGQEFIPNTDSPSDTWLEKYIYPDDRPRVKAAISKAIRTRGIFELEHRVIRADGTLGWTFSRAVPLTNESGDISEWLGTAKDITERKSAEEAINSQRQLLETVVNHMPAAVCLIRGSDLRLQLVNPAYQAIAPGKQMVGSTLEDLWPETGQNFSELCRRVLETGEPYHVQDELNTIRRRSDGPLEEAYFTWSLHRLRMPGGEGWGILNTCWETTARKKAEEALRDSEERFHTMANAIPQLAWIAQADGYIYWYNQRWYEYTGTRPEQMEGWGWQSVHDPNELPKVMERWQSSIATGNPFDMIFPLRGADGIFRPFLTRVMPLKDEQGRVHHWFGTNTDVTEQKRAEDLLRQLTEDLKRSNDDLQQFAYAASHDLQEPLRTISSFLVLFEQRYKPQLDDRAREYIRFAVEGGARMSQLINDLLEYSRIESQGKSFQPTSTMKALAGALANLQVIIHEAEAKITHDDLPVVAGDSAQITQIFQNLIGNAIKFRSEERPCQIHIGSQQKDDRWEFSVRDNGIGIEAQYKDKIFIIFQRLHTRKKYAGTGIGLSICKRIVERHGGRIWLESTPGEGTTFFFTLQGTNSES